MDTLEALRDWFKSALVHAGMSGADIGRLVWNDDRSIAGKIMSGKRRLKAEEISAVSKATSYPVPSIVAPNVVETASLVLAPRVVQEVELGPDISRADMIIGHDVPVLGTAMGGTESDERPIDFWLTGEVENHVARPKGLAKAKNVFALYVGGDSMEPRYEDRDLIFVQKAMPGIGDDVVIELHPLVDGGDHPTFIKRLVRRNQTYITVKQYNPPKNIDFTIKEIRNLFRVIPTKEWVG